MDNQPSSATSPQPFTEDVSAVPDPQIQPVETNFPGFAAPVLSPEVAPGIQPPPVYLIDPQAKVAQRGLVMGLISWLAIFLYVGSVISNFLPYSFLHPLAGITGCGSFVASLVAPILGIIFSALGLKSTTKKGLAIIGLILSSIPLAIMLLFFMMVLMFVWSQ